MSEPCSVLSVRVAGRGCGQAGVPRGGGGGAARGRVLRVHAGRHALRDHPGGAGARPARDGHQAHGEDPRPAPAARGEGEGEERAAADRGPQEV